MITATDIKISIVRCSPGFDIAESIDVVQDDDCLNEVTVVEFIDFDVLDLEESHDTLCP